MRLLHRARKPERAGGCAVGWRPYAGTLERRIRVYALERIVTAALAGDDARTEKLRSAIFDADFRRAATNAELARRSGVSRRHFQRRRAEAIASIARYAGGLLGPLPR